METIFGGISVNKIDINQSLIKKLKKGKNKIASFILATTILSGCEANKEICQPKMKLRSQSLFRRVKSLILQNCNCKRKGQTGIMKA